jgi:uncharacterized protein (TIGR03067 family)
MSRIMLVAWVVPCLAAGCESKTASERLQGQWQRREMWGWYEFDLPEAKKGEDLGGVLSFTGDEFTYLNGTSPGHGVKGTFACDTSTRPHRIVFSFDGRTVAGIFAASHDTLQVCVGEKDDVPPTEFVRGGKRGKSRPTLLVFGRVVKKDA